MRRDILELDASYTQKRDPVELALHDVESIRLAISGGSVIDWQRLAFTSREDVSRFLATLLLDADDPFDRMRIRYVFNEAVSYLEEHLGLQFPKALRDPKDVRDIFLFASQHGGFRRNQILSCVILKLMHVIQHMEAADLKFRTPISEERFLEFAQTRIMQTARQMQEDGLPIVAFYGNRKSRSSVITKLLAKTEAVAATLFDKLRFRVVVERPEDLKSVLSHMSRELFPFNYVIPLQSHNNLLDGQGLLESLRDADARLAQEMGLPESSKEGKNEFSGASYQMINFIVDYPVRIPDKDLPSMAFELGRTVFVMVEFQLVDEITARQNEQGENAHILYKSRQQRVVHRRLKRGGGRR